MAYHDIQMIPCCGHFLIANAELTEVQISGCDTGTDWSTIHEGDMVRLILPSGQEEVVALREYQYKVLDFAKSVKKFYDACTPKEKTSGVAGILFAAPPVLSGNRTGE